MEENKPFMPPPPPHLRKQMPVETKKEPEDAQESKSADSFHILSEAENIQEEVDASKAEVQKSAPLAAKNKLKLDWNVVVNWAGLAVSLVLTALFLFLLIK